MKKPITRKDINLILMDLACSVSSNADAKDDDLEETWEYVKMDYEKLKSIMDAYLSQGENK